MRRKKSKHVKKRILLVVVFFFAVFDLSLFHNVVAYGVPAADVHASVAAAAPAKKPIAVPTGIGVPVRIKIPIIRVNAAIRSVGLAKDGSMGVPAIPRDTAWYMLGPKPGETGSAVIAGHVNWLYGATGAFERLKNLKRGDQITVEDENGAAVSFVVREMRKLDAGADAAGVFISQDGKAHLNLVTCAGVWNKRARQYTQRLVVFADKATE